MMLIALSYTTFAQVYLPPQDFSGDDFPPEGWTIENGGDDNTFEPGPMPITNEPTCTWVETSANMTIDDRIISPEIILPDDMTAKLYAQLRGSVGYAIAQYWDPDNEVRYFIEVSTDGGTTWTAVLDLDDQSSVSAAGVGWPWPDWTWFDVAIDMSDYAGETVQICFHHEKEFVPTGGGSYGITNIGIWEDIENDVQTVSIDMPNYSVMNNAVEIGGVFKNIGSNTVTSIEGEYRIDGEVAETFTIDGLNISPFATYSFDAGDPANFSSVDIFDVELEITKVNTVDDPSPDNNVKAHVISVASEAVDRKPLFEVFTSSTCGPCVDANINLTNLLANNADSTYSLVKYQVDWPGNGDPYYIEDNGIRVDYYDISGVPSLISNGQKVNNVYLFSQTDFNNASNQEAYVDFSLSHSFDGLNVSASLTSNSKINIDDVSVHFVVVEKTTYNNTGSNGETEFHHVVMAMLPDGNGTSTFLEDGATETYTASANLITTFIEEFDDLMIVAWMQDNMTHDILQSESHDLYLTTGIESAKNQSVHIFPNPGNGMFSLKGAKNSFVEVSDMSGRIVYTQKFTHDQSNMDLSNFQEGIYLVKISRENAVIAIEKLIIN